MPKKKKNIIYSEALPGLDSGLNYSPVKVMQPGVTTDSKEFTNIAIHTVSQFYGDGKQLQLFSDKIIDDFTNATGLPVTNRPNNYGVILNQSQRRVFEGILKAFSDTQYLGDKQIDKATYNKDIHPVNKIKAYSNIDSIPVIKLTQAEIIQLSGYDLKKQRQGDKIDVIDAIKVLSTKQFCFYWLRLKKDEKGKPVKNKSGDYAKEEVMEVGTLFRVKYVKEEGTDKLNYYEIHPSSVILDQVNKNYGGSYFLKVPYEWREEVKQLTGKKASSYTYEFLFWLRLQYERIRSYNAKTVNKNKPKPFTLKRSWEEVAIALKMPETMYKANRKRANKIIQEAYSIAIKLGYLQRIEDSGAGDILYLNESYYPKPGELV